MKYTDYSADDLIKDEFFQQWVFSPNEERNRFWMDFLENYPGHRERVEEARQFLSFFHVKDKDVFEARVGNLKKRINYSVDEPAPVERPKQEKRDAQPKSKFTRKKILRIAYLCALFIVGVFAIVYSFLPNEQPEAIPKLSDKVQVVFTKKGKRNLVTLPDGTKVWLNAESSLTYPKNMDSLKNRTVKLSGEAFFQVSENLQKPFVVQVGEVNVVGYAASFDVKAYSSANVEAIVLTGRVRMEHKDQPINKVTISPEQSATFDTITNNMVVDNNVNAAMLSAWRNGVIYFQEQRFAQIKTTLERWYDINIHIEDTTSLSCHFTGELNNKTLRETLNMFVKDKPASFVVNGSDVLIKGKLCQ
jgi:ferric-dicitrate binding protein FerR (iron transport regulator)